jgi:hypothetical protein
MPDQRIGPVILSQEPFFADRRVLVTRGAGFVGGALARRLVALGARLTVLHDLFTGQRDAVPPQASIIEDSVTNASLVHGLIAGASIGFHLAARNIIASTANPLEDLATNIGGTLMVLLAARDTRTQRVVYSSSASVYGNPRSIPTQKDDAIVLHSPYASASWPVRTTAPRSMTLPSAVSATRKSTVHASGRTIPVAASYRNSWQRCTDRRRSQSTVTVSRRDRRDIDNIRRRVMNIERPENAPLAAATTLEVGLQATDRWLRGDGGIDGIGCAGSGLSSR